ncbi:uncharacterized protein PG986_005593 [Apiospora aurea]|uniref:Uncharacterized protein n=1 Tax=Apiospora aurea TaxID=335848 RepID=A0ABR1QI05_9PEZI
MPNEETPRPPPIPGPPLDPSPPTLPTPQAPFRFLALPPEIRGLVYIFVLWEDDNNNAPKPERRHLALCPYAPRDTTSFPEPPFVQARWKSIQTAAGP